MLRHWVVLLLLAPPYVVGDDDDACNLNFCSAGDSWGLSTVTLGLTSALGIDDVDLNFVCDRSCTEWTFTCDCDGTKYRERVCECDCTTGFWDSTQRQRCSVAQCSSPDESWGAYEECPATQCDAFSWQTRTSSCGNTSGQSCGWYCGVTCPALTNPSNGQWENNGCSGAEPKDTCTLTCNDGYRPAYGRTVTTCRQNDGRHQVADGDASWDWVTTQCRNDVWWADQELEQGKVYSHGCCTLSFQGDGNLIIRGSNGAAIWSSKTKGTNPTKLVLQGDNNLVMRDASGAAVWASGTRKGDSGALVFNNGQLEIRDKNSVVIGSTGTANGANSSHWGEFTMVYPGWWSDQQLEQGVTYRNGDYTLKWQSDGNLVLRGTSGAALWASGTNGKGVTMMKFQGDNNFVMRDANSNPVWETGTNIGAAGGRIFLQSDGNLVVRTGKNDVIGYTGTTGGTNSSTFASFHLVVPQSSTSSSSLRDANTSAVAVAVAVADKLSANSNNESALKTKGTGGLLALVGIGAGLVLVVVVLAVLLVWRRAAASHSEDQHELAAQ